MNQYFAAHVQTENSNGEEKIAEVLFFHSFRSARDAYLFLFSEFKNLPAPHPWLKEKNVLTKPDLSSLKKQSLEPVSLLADVTFNSMNDILPLLHFITPVNSLGYMTHATDYLKIVQSETNDRKLFLSGPVIVPFERKKYVTLSANLKDKFILAGNFRLADLEEIEMAEKMLFLYGK